MKKHNNYFQVTLCAAAFGGGFVPGRSEEALNNVVIDSSGLLLRFTVSDKHLRLFSWAGKYGSTLEDVTLKPLDCIVCSCLATALIIPKGNRGRVEDDQW